MTAQQDREQLFLELVNRARLDPAGEARRYGLSNLSEGTGVTISAAAKQVLAWNPLLYNSATGHSQWMVANDAFDHMGLNGSSPYQRIMNTGYAGSAINWGTGENISWNGVTGSLDIVGSVHGQHRALFLSAGHRANILNGEYEELGVSALMDAHYQGFNSLVSTFNFGYETQPVFVTGVHYTDRDGDNFYSIGESNSGRMAQLFRGSALLGSTSTAAAGGYQIQTAATGTLEMVYSGGGLVGQRGVIFVAGALNIKIDLTDNSTIETNVSATLTRNSLNLTLISIDKVNGTGNALNNIITGNASSNQLFGKGGADNLDGGAGADHLWGGAGADRITGGAGIDFARYDDGVWGNLVLRLDNSALNSGLTATGDIYSAVEGLISGSGNDVVFGNNGTNFLFGSAGNDVIDGLGGSDRLNGGAGADRFRFSSMPSSSNVDYISDFARSIDDIVLARGIFAAIGTKLDPTEFRVGTRALDANDFIIHNRSTGALSYDSNGSLAGGLMHFASLEPGAVITAADFMIG